MYWRKLLLNKKVDCVNTLNCVLFTLVGNYSNLFHSLHIHSRECNPNMICVVVLTALNGLYGRKDIANDQWRCTHGEKKLVICNLDNSSVQLRAII